jgi:hypothetical protein
LQSWEWQGVRILDAQTKVL